MAPWTSFHDLSASCYHSHQLVIHNYNTFTELSSLAKIGRYNNKLSSRSKGRYLGGDQSCLVASSRVPMYVFPFHVTLTMSTPRKQTDAMYCREIEDSRMINFCHSASYGFSIK